MLFAPMAPLIFPWGNAPGKNREKSFPKNQALKARIDLALALSPQIAFIEIHAVFAQKSRDTPPGNSANNGAPVAHRCIAARRRADQGRQRTHYTHAARKAVISSIRR